MSGKKVSKRFLGRIRSSKLFIYTVVNLAVFIDAYIYGLIIPVLPFALVERVHLPEGEVQKWIGILLAAYGAGLIIGSPVAGWFADRSGSRRGPYLWGLIALAIATLAFSVGRTVWILLIGRLVQGASSASVHTVGMAILSDTVGKAGIGPAMGFVTMNIAMGAVLGPMLGGILYHNLGYLAVFVSAYALVALDFLLRVLMISHKEGDPEEEVVKPSNRNYGTSQCTSKPSSSRTSCDSASSLLSETSSASSSSSSAASSPSSNAPPSLQKQPTTHHHHPLRTLLTNPRMLTAILGDFMQSVVLTSLESILPLRIKLLFHYNSQLVALTFLPLSLAPLFGPLFGHLSDRIGAKALVAAGFLLSAPFLMLLRLVDHDSTSQVALLCSLLLLLGLALNMILTPVYAEATYVVDDLSAVDAGVFGEGGAYAQAFGLMNVAYAAGSLVGPLLGGLLVERVGWRDLMLGMGVVMAVCAGPVLWAMGGRRRRTGEGVGEEG